MREVAAAVIVPRFGRLAAADLHRKQAGDLVTVADREAEEILTARLLEILPGSRVVAEEAASADPSLLAQVAAPGATWVVDPLDGTTNFASGQEPFAVMVALLRDGLPVAAWILDPVTGTAAVAERGSGTYLGGTRVVVRTEHRPPHQLTGYAASSYRAPSPAAVRVTSGRNCAGFDYLALLRDEQQFALFHRTLPWDHAPGVLLVEEAGGVAWRTDGTPYLPADDRTGLLVAQNQHGWDAVRSALLADIPTPR